MSALPWTLLGLPENFELPHLELALAPASALDALDGGQVSKPETLNVRSCRGDVGGLFDEAIFGGLGRDPQNRDNPRLDLIAERDGLPEDEQPATAHPRRDRFGHIDLVEPVIHPAFCVADPGWLEQRTGLGRKAVAELQRRDAALVVDAEAGADLDVGQLVSAEDALARVDDGSVAFETGATAIAWKLRRRGQTILPLMQRVWVLPVQLRPVILLESGRFESADLNEHYRRLLSRNNRLARLLELDAPAVILRNERRGLLEVLERLFYNRLCDQPLTGPNLAMLQGLVDVAGGDTLDEQLRGLDDAYAREGAPALDGRATLPWALFTTLRCLQAMGFALIMRNASR